ncbi:MAG: hypothetical protein ACSHW7_00840 [Patiriisocius sp.]|uniref:hypothetical protein n=1 Tax=Patiriisocius sp. TaxID=2822396 RepID=UPI003EF4D908
MKTIKKLIVFALFAIVFSTYGQTHTWIQNNGNTNWSIASNWSANSVPNSTSDVLIPDGYEVDITTPSSANRIFLQGSAQLTVSNNLTLQEGMDIDIVAQLNYSDGTITGGIIENEGVIRFENPQPKLISNVVINNYNLMYFADSNIVNIGNGSIINNT